VHFIVKGRGLAESKVRRATELSVEKYCSALATLAKTATISHDFEIIETAAA
jgi:putative redox protein